MDETRPGDRPTRTVRWGREASTDHSHEDGARAVDAVRLTPQDLQPTRHRRVPAPHRPATTARNCETRGTCPANPVTSLIRASRTASSLATRRENSRLPSASITTQW